MIYNNLKLRYFLDLDIKHGLKYMPTDMIYDKDDGSYYIMRFINIKSKDSLIYQINKIIDELKFINGHVNMRKDYEQNKVTNVLSHTIGILKKFLTLDIDTIVDKLRDKEVSIMNINPYMTDDIDISVQLSLHNNLSNYTYRLSEITYKQLEKSAESRYPREYKINNNYAVDKLLQDMAEYLSKEENI